MLAGAVKVRLRYGGSTREVRRTYGKSTVKYGKSTVLYGNFFLAPTVACSPLLCSRTSRGQGLGVTGLY